jgi:hypothetical protein
MSPASSRPSVLDRYVAWLWRNVVLRILLR